MKQRIVDVLGIAAIIAAWLAIAGTLYLALLNIISRHYMTYTITLTEEQRSTLIQVLTFATSHTVNQTGHERVVTKELLKIVDTVCEDNIPEWNRPARKN